MADCSISKYEILYYKRSNKVHQSKGVSKYDGSLSINHQTSQIELKSDENQKIISTILPDIAKREIDIDDIITLSGYNIEIISNISENGSDLKRKAPNATKQQLPMRRKVLKISNQIKPSTTKSTPLNQQSKPEWTRIRKPPPQPVRSTLNTQPMTSKMPSPAELSVPKAVPSVKTVTKTITVKRRPLPNIVSQSQNADLLSTQQQIVSQVLAHIPLPQSIRNALRPHQIDGIDFLWKALHQNRGACLADEMGLGKTLMTIAVLCALHRTNRDKQFIVVCPSSLVSNWAKEFDKWIGKATQPKRVVIRKGGEEGIRQIKAYCASMKQQLAHHTGQVLIISYDLLRLNTEYFQEISRSFGLVVADEAHRLKNTAGSQTMSALQALETDARLCITATPIQNNLKEFWNIANFCCPGVLGDLSSFAREYERPIQASNKKDASIREQSHGEAQSKLLEEITQTFMLRRLQKDVLKTMLPPRTEFLLFCKPSEYQRDLYRNITENSTTSITAEALNKLTTLRKLCCHPSLFENMNYGNGMPGKAVELSGKVSVLATLLKMIRTHSPDDKVVVVSNFTSALTLVEKLVLEPNKMSCLRLDGTTETSKRQSIVDSFNRMSVDHSFCLLLSAKAGGCGLNLVGASRLVLFDGDWNPAVDVQAMGRIYRQGQTKPCSIYRLFTAGTLEEVIYQRQAQKDNLTNLTVDGNSGKNSEGRFTPEELVDCFTLKDSSCETKMKLGDKWPEYSGPETLYLLGCQDEPLLAAVEATGGVVSHVHIVDENDPCGPRTDTREDESSQIDIESSDSEEEFEF